MFLKKASNTKIGKFGEERAKEYLEGLGYKILGTNVRFSRESEIDIIAQDGETTVFVEVKTRSSLSCGHPFEAVTKTKLSKILTGIYKYVKDNKCKKYRLDVISVLGKENPKIEHLKNVEP